ncbi:MAG: GNAT family N-acetyltransferase [Fimbriimonadales bacterium]
MQFAIQNLTESEIPGVVELQSACFPPPFPDELLWTASQLQTHITVFPKGQFVALADGSVIASCTNMLIPTASWNKITTWEELTGGHFLNRHSPSGEILFGVDISVHPNFRKLGIARALYERRFSFIRSGGLAAFATCCRMPDYQELNRELTVKQYADSVSLAVRTDRTLTPLLRMGLQYKGVAEQFMHDEESGNAAAILEWKP